MQGNGEDHANDDRASRHMRARRASPRPSTAPRGSTCSRRMDLPARAGSTHRASAADTRLASAAPRSPGHFAGLTCWYSFSIRPLYDGPMHPGERGTAMGRLFAGLRRTRRA